MTYPKAYKLAKARKKSTKKRKAKRTAKQIAATKRLVAFNKKRAAKRRSNPVKKISVKKSVIKKSPVKRRVVKKQSVKKSARYANPRRKTVARKKWYILCVVPSAVGIKKGINPKKIGYWTGEKWDTDKTKGARLPSVQAARSLALMLPRKYRSGVDWSYATETI